MSRSNVSGAAQKQFVRLFDSVCNWNQRWERWQDMISLFAIGIANATDHVHAKERAEHYDHICAKYKPEEFAVFYDLFSELVSCLDENPFQDFLGQMYMELELGSHWHGQFFTPYNLCKMMATSIINDETLQRIEDRGWIAANDPACGGGATLIGLADALRERGVNYQQHVLFVGQDLDHVAAMMCYVQLSLLGCAGYVHIGDTLAKPLTGDVLMPDGSADTWYTPMYFSNVWAGRVIWNHYLSPMYNRLPGTQKEVKHHAAQLAKQPESKPKPKPGNQQLCFLD